jgi:hypothetical protein
MKFNLTFLSVYHGRKFRIEHLAEEQRLVKFGGIIKPFLEDW